MFRRPKVVFESEAADYMKYAADEHTTWVAIADGPEHFFDEGGGSTPDVGGFGSPFQLFAV